MQAAYQSPYNTMQTGTMSVAAAAAAGYYPQNAYGMFSQSYGKKNILFIFKTIHNC